MNATSTFNECGQEMPDSPSDQVPPGQPSEDMDSFRTYLSRCRRTVALLGAGLSASSGLPTFRGAGGLWRNRDAMSLATPGAFTADPALVWRFYAWRRAMALRATPNAGHYALANFARSRGAEFLTLSQNVDGKDASRLSRPPDACKSFDIS